MDLGVFLFLVLLVFSLQGNRDVRYQESPTDECSGGEVRSGCLQAFLSSLPEQQQICSGLKKVFWFLHVHQHTAMLRCSTAGQWLLTPGFPLLL